MFEVVRTIALVAATVAMGLAAGLFYAFAYAVMPGLGRTDDRTFVGAMQQMNVAILNGWFAACFGGAIVLSVLAAVLHVRADGHSALPWIVAGAVLYFAVIVVTMALNVPLNEQLNAAGEPDRIGDLAAVRDRFESAWVRWNVLRALFSTAAFACLAWALVLHGRITSAGS